jgi:hypothetical protein
MTLSADVRTEILDYCDKHLPSDKKVSALFDFVQDSGLRARIIDEFNAARYIYKLGEALSVRDIRLYAHVKSFKLNNTQEYTRHL